MRTRLSWLAILVALSTPGLAQARRETTFVYPFSRVWPTAVRLLRVDLECPITEKDKEEGYFFFTYADHGKTFPGSVELISTKEGSQESVRVVVQVPAMPSYVEAMMLDRLARKLQEQFGSPKGASPAPVPPKTDDAPFPAEPPAKPAPVPARKRPAADVLVDAPPPAEVPRD